MANHALPNLIVAGVHKAGTTSLFAYLSRHPDICPSKVKETQFFLPLAYGARHLPPIEQYSRFFDHCKDAKYIMEATLGYFYGGAVVAEAIREQLGDVRILLVFRNPVERLFSFYKFQKGMLALDRDLTLDQYVRLCTSLHPDERRERENFVYQGLDGGYYSDYIDAWFDVFGEESVRVLFFEHLKSDPVLFLTELCEWLELEHATFIASLQLSVENKSVNYRNRFLQKLALSVNWWGESFWRSHPQLKNRLRRVYYAINGMPHRETMSDELQGYLETFFRPYNQRLAIALSSRGYANLPSWLSRELETLTMEPMRS